jgi:hypothetical protein
MIGAVDQTIAGDTGCLDLAIPCTQDNTQPICVYRDQISIFHMDAMYATGPVTGDIYIVIYTYIYIYMYIRISYGCYVRYRPRYM